MYHEHILHWKRRPVFHSGVPPPHSYRQFWYKLWYNHVAPNLIEHFYFTWKLIFILFHPTYFRIKAMSRAYSDTDDYSEHGLNVRISCRIRFYTYLQSCDDVARFPRCTFIITLRSRGRRRRWRVGGIDYTRKSGRSGWRGRAITTHWMASCSTDGRQIHQNTAFTYCQDSFCTTDTESHCQKLGDHHCCRLDPPY